MTTKIDQVILTNLPSHVTLQEPRIVVTPTAGYGKTIYVPRTPGVVTMLWGGENAVAAVVAELRSKRGQTPQHVLSWTKEGGTGLYHRNVVIPPLFYSQGPGAVVDTFSLDCEEYRPIPCLATILLYRPGTITVVDGAAKWEAPAGGRILSVDGYIGTLGTGAGQTRIQVSNGATDYLSTRGDFVVASATGLMENEVLAASPTFNRGDILELDVDAIPADSNSADLQVYVYAIVYPV